MASSFEPGWVTRLFAWGIVALAGCSVDAGEGRISATVSAPDCGLDGDALELRPTSFVAELVGEFLNIHVRRGGERLDFADGISVQLREASQVKTERLGQPLALGPRGSESLVAMTFFLNATCPIDFARLPVVYYCESGTVTFDSVYAREVDSGDTEISAHFENVECVDPTRRETRRATISGEFRFFYTRGRPAQRFP